MGSSSRSSRRRFGLIYGICRQRASRACPLRFETRRMSCVNSDPMNLKPDPSGRGERLRVAAVGRSTITLHERR